MQANVDPSFPVWIAVVNCSEHLLTRKGALEIRSLKPVIQVKTQLKMKVTKHSKTLGKSHLPFPSRGVPVNRIIMSVHIFFLSTLTIHTHIPTPTPPPLPTPTPMFNTCWHYSLDIVDIWVNPHIHCISAIDFQLDYSFEVLIGNYFLFHTTRIISRNYTVLSLKLKMVRTRNTSISKLSFVHFSFG